MVEADDECNVSVADCSEQVRPVAGEVDSETVTVPLKPFRLVALTETGGIPPTGTMTCPGAVEIAKSTTWKTGAGLVECADTPRTAVALTATE